MTEKTALTTAGVMLVVSLSLGTAAEAQHSGHGMGSSHPMSSAPGTQLATAQETMRAVDVMIATTTSVVRELSISPMAAGHEETIKSLGGALGFVGRLRNSLVTEMNGADLGADGPAMKELAQASRDLEKMTSALQSVTKNLREALVHLHTTRR